MDSWHLFITVFLNSPHLERNDSQIIKNWRKSGIITSLHKTVLKFPTAGGSNLIIKCFAPGEKLLPILSLGPMPDKIL